MEYIEIEISKEELLKLLFEGNQVGMGSYGILKEIDPTTLAKIYYKEIKDTYLSKDPSKLDKEIETNKCVHEIIKKMHNTDEFDELERLERTKLEYLFKIGLLKGILMYNGYKIGVLLNYYKDYIKLTEISNTLSVDNLYFVMKRIKEQLEEMMKHGIFPRDLREDNILVRQEDLNVVFIDLDGSETRFEREDYVLAHPYMISDCLGRYAQIKKRVFQRNNH